MAVPLCHNLEDVEPAVLVIRVDVLPLEELGTPRHPALWHEPADLGHAVALLAEGRALEIADIEVASARRVPRDGDVPAVVRDVEDVGRARLGQLLPVPGED